MVGRGGSPVVAAEEGVQDAEGGGVLAGKEEKRMMWTAVPLYCPRARTGGDSSICQVPPRRKMRERRGGGGGLVIGRGH